MADLDKTVSNSDAYHTLFENDRVRVLDYYDTPGHKTTPHGHPDSIMYALSSYRRRLASGDGPVAEVELSAGTVRWVGAQQHYGENIADTDSHCILVELKEPAPPAAQATEVPLGPSQN